MPDDSSIAALAKAALPRLLGAPGGTAPERPSTGVEALDALIGGWRRGSLHVLASRRWIGQSALLTWFALARRDRPVVVVSLGESAARWSERAVCAISGVDRAKARLGRLDEGEQERATAAATELARSAIAVRDASQTFDRGLAAAEAIAETSGLGLLVIDGLGRDPRSALPPPTGERGALLAAARAEVQRRRLGKLEEVAKLRGLATALVGL